MIEWDHQHVWHAFSQMSCYDGLIIQSAEGCWLTDIAGKRYFDGVSSMWCNIHGHRHPTIDSAIRAQLDQVSHVTSLGMSHPTTILLAKRLTEIAPKGLDRVFFSSDGASAVEVALKMAYQYWRQIDSPQPERTTFLAVGNSYHGDTLGACSVGGIGQFHSMFRSLLFPVLRGPCPDTYRHGMRFNSQMASQVSTRECSCDFATKKTNCLEYTKQSIDPVDKADPVGADRDACTIPACKLTDFYLSQYRSILEQQGHRIAAIIVEPMIQGAAGMVIHPPGFLKGLRKLATEFNTLLIADEVAVGMGRTGKMFACEHEQVVPDFLCLGKGLTGGYLPMSATMTTSRVCQAFLGEYADGVTFFHGHTYAGNPLSAAAAMATLDIFESDQTIAKMKTKSERFRFGLSKLVEHPNVGDIRQLGLMIAVELVEEKIGKIPYPLSQRRGAKACRFATDAGVWLRPLGNNIVLVPPLVINDSEIDLLVRTVYDAVDFATNN